MSSAGQVVGGIVGGIVGFFAGGNVALGASIGMAIGGYIDPPKGPKGRPPSASDLAVQTATYGAPLGRGYGTYGTLGNIFWVEGNSLRAEEAEAQGGKGGSPAGPSTYNIFGTFAVGFGEGEIAGYGRIWCSGKLVADYTSSSLDGIIATNDLGGTITLYTGSASQLPDDRIQADMGAVNTPAYRGLHYIVFKDWPMGDYGNSLMGMQIKAEIIHSQTSQTMVLLDTQTESRYGTQGTITVAQNIVNADYDIFSLAEKQFVGTPNPAPFEVTEWAFVSTPSTITFNTEWVSIPDNFSNQSPNNFGVFTKSGNNYYLNGAEWGVIDETVGPVGPSIWVEVSGSILGVGTIGGNDVIVRVYPGGTVSTSSLGAHQDGAGRIFVAGGVGYVLRPDYSVVVFNAETLAVTETRTFFYDDGYTTDWFISAWCITVDEHGRAWRACSSSRQSIARLNATMTSFDLTYSISHYVDALAVWGGLIYTATTPSGTSTTTYRVYQQQVNTPSMDTLANIISSECLSSGLLDTTDIDVADINQDVRGYKVSGIAAIRMALEPLQAAWPFDVIPSGYKIKFVRRGKSPVATIELNELGAVAGNDRPGVRITASREMDSQLPRKVMVSYLDVSREYDLNTGPGAERLSTDAVNVLQTELPIVLNANEAAQLEEVLLYMYWLERNDITFILPPTRVNLEASDVITINGDAATYQVRLTQINYLPDGRMECSAKLNNSTVYTSTAVGQEGLSVGQTLSLAGASLAVLLDIPVLLDSQDAPGFTTAMSGRLAGWNGGVLVRTDDGGETWDTLQYFAAPGAVVGYANSVLATGSSDIKDVFSTLNISLLTGTLSSTTELGMLNGANHFALGSNGRWEIIAAQTCIQQSDGTWLLRDLLRGRFGTEWAMTTHQASDTIVLLDSAKLQFVGSSVNSIGLARTYRAVTSGKPVDTATDIAFTYEGQNLECLSPVYPNGSIDGSNNWAVTATRRTRVGGEWRDYVDASLGETSEAYEAEIWNDTFTTLKRTISGLTTCGFPYTSAQQTADFGGLKKLLPFKLYQLSSVVGRGQPLVATLDRNFDPNFASLVLGCHFNDAPWSSTFACIKGNTLTSQNTTFATTTTDQSVFGGIALMAGDVNYISIAANSALNFGTNNFTIRCWYRAGTTGSTQIYGDGTTTQFGFGQKYSGGLAFEMYGAGSAIYSTGYSYTLGVWYFLEVVRSGNTYYLFIDGTLVGSATPASNSWTYSSGVRFGTASGHYDDLQVYNGVALHTTSFTKPIETFADK